MSDLLPTPTTRTAPAFALLATVQMLLISGATATSVSLPAVRHALHLDQRELAMVSSAYGISFSGLLLLGGRLADLRGRRRVLRLGIALFAAGCAAACVAPGLWTLVLTRLAQGAGAALAAPSAMALLPALFPDPARRTRALASWGGLSGVGAVCGMALSGAVVQWVSWRWTFAVLMAVALPALALAPRLLPADGPPRRARLDVPGALLAVGGLSSLSYGLLEGSAICLALGAVALTALVLVESRTTAPLLPLPFLASLPRAAGLTAIMSASASMAASLFFLSLHLQQDRGLDPLRTVAVLLPYGLVLVATGAFAGRLTARLGARTLLVAGLCTATAGLALIAGLDGFRLGAGLLVLPFGIGLTFSGAAVTVADGVPDEQAGLAGGMVNTAMEVGPSVGLGLLVTLASAHADNYGFALETAAAVLGAAALLAAALPRPRYGE